MAEEQKSYNVAFAYTRTTGGYEGVITWASFESKEEFDKWYTEEMRKAKRVVEEDITKERAIELARQTPTVCRLAAAYQEAKNHSPEGKINQDVLEFELEKALFAISGDIRNSE